MISSELSPTMSQLKRASACTLEIITSIIRDAFFKVILMDQMVNSLPCLSLNVPKGHTKWSPWIQPVSITFLWRSSNYHCNLLFFFYFYTLNIPTIKTSKLVESVKIHTMVSYWLKMFTVEGCFKLNSTLVCHQLQNSFYQMMNNSLLFTKK